MLSRIMGSRRALVLLGLLLVFGIIGIALADFQLRQCSNGNCGKYALSDMWNFCPYCGTKLSPVSAVSKWELKNEYIVLGNIYKNNKLNFQIERPNQDWEFMTERKDLVEFNPDATVAMMSNKDVCSMVIIEDLPDVDLKGYADLVQPSLEDRVKLSQKDVTINDLNAIKIKWSGTTSGLPFIFYYTLVKYEKWRVQIVSWCVASNDTKETQIQIAAIEDSFRMPMREGKDHTYPAESK